MITPVLPSYARFDLAFERGEGAYLWTTGGERFLDMVAGLAVNGLGHAHPVLVNALKAQAEKLWHTSNLYRIPGQERLAERLVAASFADTVFFCNSGAEAVECSIKMARIHHHAKGNPERYRLITLEGAFHGRTLAAIAAGGNEKHLNGFGPKVDGFDQVAYGDPAAIAAAIGPQTAGVLLEPVQGEGGVRPASTGYLKALRELCDAHGILLLFDEVQCGMGRTGKLFAHEWSGVTPDIMAVAKAIGGGFPMGLCLATENAAQGMTAGSHASTYGGNPLACAVGNAVLDVMLADGFMDRVVTAGLYLKQQLAMLRDKHPTIIESVNGEGLMIGIRMKVLNTDMVKALLGEKMLSAAAGDNQVRLLPPLNITDAEMGEAIAAIDRACAKLGAAS
ncbi:MAG: aspartate aminotransferase family protein [Pseudomonadota bacterium]|jgi:acetylornithine/N-succinyldiaminopimelate aminotransferase|nr:acetylornithine transaminase [Alphaproteobacteria bacterium]